MAFDLPTQLGLDSDDPRCLGEVGRTGVAIDTLDDMRTAFDGIPLDEVSTSMTINAPAAVLLLLYELVAEEQGVDERAARGHRPERHPQGVHRARELHLPARAVDAADDGPVRLLQGEHPEVEHGLDLRLPLPREGLLGASRRSRSRWPTAWPTCRRRSTPASQVDDFAPRLAFFFNGHNNVFQEVAKFRAARQHVGARDDATASAPRTRSR